jgi:hypothetical protein
MSTGSTTTTNQTSLASQLFSGLTQGSQTGVTGQSGFGATSDLTQQNTTGQTSGATTGTSSGSTVQNTSGGSQQVQQAAQTGSQQNVMGSTNQALTSLFTGMMSGGGAQAGIGSLTNIANGANLEQLNTQLMAGNKAAFASNVGQIKESFGAGGMGASSSLSRVLGASAATNAAQMTSTLASADLEAQQQQLQAGNYLAQIFSGAANNYYTQNQITTGQTTGTTSGSQYGTTSGQDYSSTAGTSSGSQSGSSTGSSYGSNVSDSSGYSAGQQTEASIKEGSSTENQYGKSSTSSSPLGTALSIFGTLFG